jgi:hypothetical protein
MALLLAALSVLFPLADLNAGYWFALRKQTERYGLDGQPTGTVTDTERQVALQKCLGAPTADHPANQP